MKTFLRNLFSGYFFVLLLLLIELLAVLAFQFSLDYIVDFFGWGDFHVAITVIFFVYKVIELIITLLVFFRILNKPEDPEFKIPWLVGMLLLPIFTSILFLIFGNHGISRSDSRAIYASKKNFNLYKKEHPFKTLEEDAGNAIGSINYIANTTGLSAHAHNRVKYYATGEEFFPEMIESLKLAKEFIFIEFFIITDGALWDEVKKILIEKAQSGVEVRLVYDDMGCGGTISHNTPKILGEYGIQCVKFHPFRPILSGVYNNRDHRKIVVVDHLCAFTGGCNLADEYANLITRFGYWKDTMVKIEGSAINNLIATFLQNFDIASQAVTESAKYLDYEYPRFEDEGIVMPFGDGPGGIDDALIGEQNYINLLNYAKKTVYISTPYLIPTYSLTDALRNAALRGVDVHLIVPGIPDKKAVYTVAKSNFAYLMEAGVHIYTYTPGFNHMKTALADGELGFVGTINFDFRSLVHHFECGTLLYKTPCLKDIEADFLSMLEVSKKVPEDFTLRLRSRCFTSVVKLFVPML